MGRRQTADVRWAVFPIRKRVQAPAAPGFYRSCAGALTDGFRPQSGLVQRGVFYAACRQQSPLRWLAPPPSLPLRGGTMDAGQWCQSEFMAAAERKPYNRASPEENQPTSLCSWKCTPIPASRDFPRRGKFALISASEFISISKHSAARISPFGGNAIKLRISQIFSNRKLLRACGFIMQQNHNKSSHIFNKNY